MGRLAVSRRDVVLGFSGLVVLAAIGGGLWVQNNEAKPPAPHVIVEQTPLDLQVAETSAPLAPALSDTSGRQVPTSEAQVQLSFAPIVKQVEPAVVNVYATKTEQGFVSPFANDPFFSQLFGGDLLPSRPSTSQSLGSGVIIDPKGI